MKLLAVFSCLLAGCLAERPHPCSSPPLMTGALTVSTQNEKFWTYAKYYYDAMGKRIRVKEMGTYENKTFTYDALLLFREGTMYEINNADRTCKKRPLKAEFQPLAVPKNASLLAQAVLGSSSAPGEGLLVNTWMGHMSNKGMYMMTVTEFGCIPVATTFQTEQFGWMVTSYFNNVAGISDPGQLNPPGFCPDEETDDGPGEIAKFLTVFMKKQ
ncbi:ependymin-like [Solea senegalensis]|uniref:Ependymin-like n=1 Tax=Solea senegalensis TaxID=28829 RepID=A0AAV6QX43_SOLSE|nr:ependymin-like [Solea senegalensis]